MKHFCSFSEAIREGSKIRPQGFKSPYRRTDSGTSCALEAGIEALALGIHWSDEIRLTEIFPYLSTVVRSPIGASWHRLYELCWMLNDHGWAREAIADWLEKEEEKLGFVTISITEESSSQSVALERVGV